MFAILRKEKNGFNKVVLKDSSSGITAEIIPSCGAILHSFKINVKGEKINVIDSYHDADDFKNTLTKSFKGSKLSPFVCRLNNAEYEFDHNRYKPQKCIVEGHALHGELFDAPFKITSEGLSDKGAYVTLQYEYRKNDPGYPFNYDCFVTYKLEENNKLNIITEILNKDTTLIPVQDGWHPYFTVGEKINDFDLQFKAIEKIIYSDTLIPTGESIPYSKFHSFKKIGNTVFDNCFLLDLSDGEATCILRNLTRKIQVEINTDLSYPYLQIYTPPHRKSIAIENLSSLPDAFNNKTGLKILEPGESSLFRTFYKITLLQ